MRAFVVGAGASIDHSCGIVPGAERFAVRAIGVLQTEDAPVIQRSAFQQAIVRFYGFDPFDQNRRRQLEGVNIEELLTLCALEREIEPQFSVVSPLTEVIVRTVSTCQSEVGPDASTYRRFVDEVLQPTDSVLTFNWDTLLDPLIPGYKPYGDSAGDGMYRNYQRFCTAEYERTWKGFGFQESYSDVAELAARHEGGEDRAFIKLHGSVDLLHCVNAGCRQHAKPFRSAGHDGRRYCGECHEPLAAFIVPPVQAKPIRQSPYVRRAWSVASRLMQRADEVVFWGYSLPPTDFWASWLIRHAWFGTCKRIVVINPDAFFKKQERPRLDFVRRFAPVRFARGKQEVLVCRNFCDYVAGRSETVSSPSDDEG